MNINIRTAVNRDAILLYGFNDFVKEFIYIPVFRFDIMCVPQIINSYLKK